MKFAPSSVAALATCLFALAACNSGSVETGQPETETAVAPAASARPVVTAQVAAAATEPDIANPIASPNTPRAVATAVAAAEPATGLAEPAAFAQCKACHSGEPGKNGIGPTLVGILDKKAGSVPDFEFSNPMKTSALVWNEANLDRYLADPRSVVPGTKMAFGGIRDAAVRKEIIEYLKTL